MCVCLLPSNTERFLRSRSAGLRCHLFRSRRLRRSRRHEKKKRAEWLAVVVGKAAAAAAAEAAFHPAVRAIETRRVSEEEKSHFVLAPCHGMCLKVVDEKCSFEECD